MAGLHDGETLQPHAVSNGYTPVAAGPGRSVDSESVPGLWIDDKSAAGVLPIARTTASDVGVYEVQQHALARVPPCDGSEGFCGVRDCGFAREFCEKRRMTVSSY